MSEYTPTTNEVRKRYSRGYLTEHVQEFDRWLAEVCDKERADERERIIKLLEKVACGCDDDFCDLTPRALSSLINGDTSE